MTIPSSDSSVEEPRPGTIDESEYHRLLSAERRRAALEIFDEWGAPYELEELAAAIVSLEADADSEKIADEPDVAHVEEAAVMLHHVHLPMMSDMGVISYDEGTNRIVPSEPKIEAIFSNPL